jgi:phosphoglycolate phosphatase-like HAD superfamily hydrolase
MMKRLAIFDVDGTLMNIQHRRHYVAGPDKDWPAFFDAMEFDTINDHVFHMAHALHNDDYNIIVVSGRNEKHREITEKQLAFGKLSYSELIMRPDNNYEPDFVFKKTILDAFVEADMKPQFAVDDRPSVVQMWRENGVPCFDVGGWHDE